MAALLTHTSLSVDEIMKLLKFCLSATFMAFRGSMLQQTFDTAMGSPISVTIANLVIEDVEEIVMEDMEERVMEDVEERALATAETSPGFGNVV